MNKRNLSRWILLSGASITGLAMCGAATTFHSALAAAPSASASASAASSGSAKAPSAAPKRPARDEPLEKQTIPSEKSSIPTIAEWKQATPVDVVRRGDDADSCIVLRVREWLKIKCDLVVGAIYQHSGNAEGVSFWVHPKMDMMTDMEAKNGGELILPLRVGDRRILQFFAFEQNPCVGIGFRPSVMVDETWIEGDTTPTVVLQ